MQAPQHPEHDASQARAGLVYGLAAYGIWALAPLYFKAVARVPAHEVVAHRVAWSVVLLALLLTFRRSWPTVRVVLRTRRTVLTLLATTFLIAANWFVFIWAVANGQVLEASLGYFINPLVNVLLGFLVLRERLRPVQVFSVALAGAGVLYLTISYGRFPAIAFFLALSFGFYGLLRKTARVESLVGLMIETSFLLPIALAYLLWLGVVGAGTFGQQGVVLDAFLIGAGAITAIPLLCFASAARRLRLSTLGLLQYVAPTGQFLLAVLLFDEVFTSAHVVAFACIWTALAAYTLDAARAAHQSVRYRALARSFSAKQ